MKEHEHAEVLRAIADGNVVQVWSECNDSWLDVLETTASNPLIRPQRRWRVKPKTKHDFVTYIFTDSHKDETPIQQTSVGLTWKLTIKVTWDGETNDPKSVELIK